MHKDFRKAKSGSICFLALITAHLNLALPTWAAVDPAAHKSAVATAAALKAAVAKAAEERAVHEVQRAVRLIDKDPRAAERLLRGLNDPQAKTYLAYLYFTKKVLIPNSSKRVDALMNSAISKVQDSGSLGEIDNAKHYHYNSLAMLLDHLRFITEASGEDISVPISIAKEHPTEFFDAFAAYWGSSRDSQCNIVLQPADDILKIPAIKEYFSVLGDIFGTRQGTIRFMFYRNQYMSQLRASLAPESYLSPSESKSKSKPKSENEVDPQLDAFLEQWSNDELYNKQLYNAWVSGRKPAESALVAFYQNHLKLPPQKASACAARALDEINTTFLGNYSKYTFNETKPSDVYKLFTHKQLSLKEVQELFDKQAPSQDQLGEALRLSILNGHSIDIIDFLVKKEAPLTGEREPAISSAVLRPDVVALLLKAGAQADEVNALGKTALFEAAQYDDLASCKLLIAAGADVNHKMIPTNGEEANHANNTGDYEYYRGELTPLMFALEYADYPLIKYLLDSGAKKTDLDSQQGGMTFYLGHNTRISKAERALLEKALK
jgi:hypothetical protein